jgi:alkylation response protein AidB-like acyl-CoA dehydrogenase
VQVSLGITEEQRLVVETAREFAWKELEPNVARWDEEEHFPRDAVMKLGELGFLGMMIPETYGGSGLDTLTYILALEEISKVDPSLAVTMSVHNSLPTSMILNHGTEEQKRKFLVPMARGEKIGAFALTEPGSGSDAASLVTSARKTEGGWVLNGTKVFITNGGTADLFIVFARTGGVHGARGISSFIVESGTRGFIVGKKERKMGLRASNTTELVFEDMLVPDENLLGAEGEGFILAMKGLDNGRLGIAAQALGIAQRCLDESLRYARGRHQFGRSIAEFEAVQFIIADMATKIEAARSLLYRAATMKDSGMAVSREASMAKLFASETAMEVAIKAVQIHGGSGYMKDFPVERFFRDAKVTEIYEGTSEIQRLVIARRLLEDV